MVNRADLDAAAEAGLITPVQAEELDAFLSGRARGAPAVAPPNGEENLRFIRNFHDVFLAIGILLLAVGMAVGIATFVYGAKDATHGTVMTGFCALGGAGVMWLLGEVFARRRRLFLPAIAIVLALTGYVVVAVATLYAGAVLGSGYESANIQGMPPQLRVAILLAAAAGIVAPALFYLRFRLPFSLGLCGAAAAAFVVIAAMIANFEATIAILPALYLVLGLALFAAGVAFDARDPARVTRMSDNGFWLHFAAAPLVLNGALGLVSLALAGGATGLGGPNAAMIGGQNAAPMAVATLVIVTLLGLVSLLINRRALIVSALLTTGVAIAILMNAVGLGAGALAAATLTTLGGLVLILGAGWHGVRRALLGWARPSGIWARVFPPEAAA